jgi:deoxycytidine triphosphate deaminase
MRQDTLINIGTLDGGHLDDNGVWVQDFQTVVSTYCFIEPYSQERAIRKYGIDVEVNKRIFIDHVDPNIKVGMYIDDGTFQIKAIPWDLKHMEIIALKKESIS